MPEPGREAALRLLKGFVSGEIDLIAPDLLLAEFASLIAKLNRRNQLSIEQARGALRWFRVFAPRFVEMQPHVPHALGLSLRHRMSLWDCIYLAVALQLNCELITADARFQSSAVLHFPFVRLLAAPAGDA